MRTSLNGWPVLDWGDGRLRLGVVPGTSRKIRCNSVALPLFLHFCAAWNKEMPARLKLDRGPLDSWEVRQARSASGYSNHASGTAIDARYDILAADNQRHMTDQELTILKRLLRRYVTADGHMVLSNGYAWRRVDEMHTELSQSWQTGAKRNTTEGDVREVIKRLGIRPDGTTSLVKVVFPPKPAPEPAPKPETPVDVASVSLADVQPGKKNGSVGLVQKALKVNGEDPGPIDGAFGIRTRVAYAAWQRKLGYSGADADGVPGKASLMALGMRYGFKVTA